MTDIMLREKQHIFQTYGRLPIAVDRAEGCKIFDQNGKEYLDFLAGIAVNALGHSHPKIINAVEKQIRRYMHLSNFFYQEPQVLLAEKITRNSCFDRVFYTNSGTEAIEGIIKIIRRHGSFKGKSDIVAFKGGFHGRTYGALSLMDKSHYKERMQPFLPGIKIIDFNSTDALELHIDENTAGVVIEFIQGEGGIREADAVFINAVNVLRHKYGFILAADEIQSGAGRTGRLFAFEHYNIEPDIAALAKGIGGGLPLGAIAARENLAAVFEKGQHGTTYGGNAAACAAGNAVMDELYAGLLAHVENMGAYFKEKLYDMLNLHPDKIKEVRGKGLMLGLEMDFDAAKVVKMLFERNIIANAAAGTVLRIVPPLIVGQKEIDIFIEKLADSLAAI